VSDTPPLFTIAHELEIAARPEEVWAVLIDFDRYSEWNPYVLALSGALKVGGTLEVTIRQANWPEPLTVTPTLIRAETDTVLHWQGRVGDAGVLDTDHSFHIETLDSDRVHFLQQEEFRGSLAETLDEQAQAFTRDAFQAMNEALAERVRALQS
jgi:hypothetical protein